MQTHNIDKAFSGQVPEIYDRYLVPLIFEAYAIDIAGRVASRKPARTLEIAAGTGVSRAPWPPRSLRMPRSWRRI